LTTIYMLILLLSFSLELKLKSTKGDHLTGAVAAIGDDPLNKGICKDGKNQSPIDIHLSDAIHDSIGKLSIAYSKSISGDFKFNGHTWQMNIPNPSNNFIVHYSDVKTGVVYRYNLAQFHIHFPSEHLLDGNQADIGFHFVHLADQSVDHDYKYQKLVIGVLGSTQSTNSNVFTQIKIDSSSVFSDLPNIVGDNNLLHYRGSLTTPPCSEDVNWFVAEKVYQIDANLIASLRKSFTDSTSHSSNNRKVNEINKRKLWSIVGSVESN